MNKLIPATALVLAACTPPAEPPRPTIPAPSGEAAATSPKAAAAQTAKVGQPAPDFTLPDLDGKPVKLADFKGKTVVLEWFNPSCPFVQRAHRTGGLKDFPAQQVQKGVVWLAINSGAPGKQGHDREENVKARSELGVSYPILLDEKGEVGRAYGAKRTPHLFVIDPKGTLVYAGAIDSTEGGEPEPTDKVVNYVDVALGELASGKAVSKAETEAFGCSVKY